MAQNNGKTNATRRTPAARRCEVTREAVDSKAFAEYGYNGEHGVLEIQFHPKKGQTRGAIWRYYFVTRQRMTAFRRSGSLGRYFTQHIRNVTAFRAECVAQAV